VGPLPSRHKYHQVCRESGGAKEWKVRGIRKRGNRGAQSEDLLLAAPGVISSYSTHASVFRGGTDFIRPTYGILGFLEQSRITKASMIYDKRVRFGVRAVFLIRFAGKVTHITVAVAPAAGHDGTGFQRRTLMRVNGKRRGRCLVVGGLPG